MSAPPLLCFGNLTVDDVVLPDGRERAGCTGGDCFYAALAARLFGVGAEMVAPVGRDLPDEVRERIRASGLSTAGLPSRDAPTIRNRVEYDAAGERRWTLLTSEADFHLLSPTPDDVPPAWRGASAALVLAMTLEAQEALLADSLPPGRTVALDPQEDYIAGNERRLSDLIGRADLFLPSEIEVERLLGHRDWTRAARELAGLGPRVVVIKRGAAGALLHDAGRGTLIEMPAVPVAVVDTTGAGDSFCGAFMAAYASDPSDLAAAAAAGVAAASFAVADFGVDGLLRAGGVGLRERAALARTRARALP